MLLFPFFSFLDHKSRGNSDVLDRIDIIELFISVFGLDRIEILTADREFIGDVWLQFLAKNGIRFVIRTKENNQHISNSKGRLVKSVELFRNLGAGEEVMLHNRKLGKNSNFFYSLSAYRNDKFELIVVVHDPNIENPCQLYCYRWQIETMFKAFKTSGFNMEGTHITDSQKLETLFGIMAIAFAISYEIGDEYEKDHHQKLKKHGYKQNSTPRIGLDLILNWMNNCKIKLVLALRRIARRIEKYCFDKTIVMKNV